MTRPLAILLLVVAGCVATAPPPAPPAADTAYEFGVPTQGGSGKLYMGREISAVVGVESASWMDREVREKEQEPELVVENLKLRPTDVVADIGAGSGYFTFRLNRRVPDGKVLAVDIQPDMLAIIERKKAEAAAGNVETVLGTELSPLLAAESVDVVLMVDAYHEFSQPLEMMQAIRAALKPDGRLVIVEYRAEDPAVRKHRLHKMTQKQIRGELATAGFVWRETRDVLPEQHFVVFGKP